MAVADVRGCITVRVLDANMEVPTGRAPGAPTSRSGDRAETGWRKQEPGASRAPGSGGGRENQARSSEVQ